MSKQEIIEQTVQVLEQLPEEKVAEILDFAAFLLHREEPLQPIAGGVTSAEDTALAQQMAVYMESSPVFAFLHDPAEDIYTLNDLKVRYQ